MSRRGSRTSRRSICSIRTARALPRRPRPTAGRRASRPARSTAFRSPSRTIWPPKASRFRSALPASGWCGLVALKPSFGRVPIDPPYVGRVAGPMTRTVDDAALMMCVLSKPDRRDGMSLPADGSIHWKAHDKSPRKVRIGLMLDPGAGQPLESDVRDVAIKAVKAFESAGAVITEVDGILTREMLDGLDHFWRARMWDDLSKLSPEERAKALP